MDCKSPGDTLLPAMTTFEITIDSDSGGSGGSLHRNINGLHWFVSTLMLIGEMAGGGLVALPAAYVKSGVWLSLALNVLMAGAATYTARLLGDNWVIMQKHWPEYRTHCRKPYAEMGLRGFGHKMRTFVSISVNVTQFGIGVVFLLLAAKNIDDFILAIFSVRVSFCLMILAVAAVLLPVTLLKSPQDFWWAVVCAMVATAVAVILVIYGSLLDWPTCHPHSFISLGVFFFAYGGHSAFPTIQHDMKNPHEFARVALIAFAVITAVYVPEALIGYYTYGSSVQYSIINSLQTVWIQQVTNLLIAFHCILAMTIIFNPLNQDLEEVLGVPHHFCIQRVLVRGVMLMFAVFVAESVPTFGPLMNLVGGTTIALTSIVFPCLFNLALAAIDNKQDTRLMLKNSPIKITVDVLVILFGVIGGFAASYSAILELSTTHFSIPCYVAPFLKSVENLTKTDLIHSTVCCGPYMNVSVTSLQFCSPGLPTH